MLQRRLLKPLWNKCQKRYAQKGSKVVTDQYIKDGLAKIRNIGILAHIDAGKTTTTERILFYSGVIKHMGEVHYGNTVTDYMDQERERGITITAAVATFMWKYHYIHLIDTPGHIDFTMEVEQTLSVLDGAIIILDGSAGVEAQTVTVCRQADKYNIPRIIYINKMDKPNANFEMSLKSIESKLHVEALPTQFPIKEKNILQGIVDVVSLEKLIFNKDTMGMKFIRSKLCKNKDKELWQSAFEKRRNLTDKLSTMDDELANLIIEKESLDEIPPQILLDSLHRSTLSRKGVPVLLGSSYKNIGVQPLMDAVLLYLPSPDQNKYDKYYHCFKRNLSARAFKVIHDKHKGPVTFFRIYTGIMEKDTVFYNVHKNISEHGRKLYFTCADEYREMDRVYSGHIVAVTGFKATTIGDLITISKETVNNAKKNLKAQEDITSEDVNKFFTSNSRMEPVFFCSIEAPSLFYQLALETALQQLQREDPSLKISIDSETSQTILAGMGQLHMEVIKQRIKSEYNIDADIGPLQISYRETITNCVKDTFTSNYKMENVNYTVTTTLSLIPNYQNNKILVLDKSPSCIKNTDAIPQKMMKAINQGVNSVLLHGPKLNYPVMDMGVKLHWLEYTPGTSPTMVTAFVAQSIKKLMYKGDIQLLEPIMMLEIVVFEEYSSKVIADLPQRRAEIQEIDMCGSNKVIKCSAPLAALLGYSTTLRKLSSGFATFTMEFKCYSKMDLNEQRKAVTRITGFS